MWVIIYKLVKNVTRGDITGICGEEKRGITDRKTQGRGCQKIFLALSEGFLLLHLPQEDLWSLGQAAYRGAVTRAMLGMKQ